MVDTDDTRRTTDNAMGMAFKLPTGELKNLVYVKSIKKPTLFDTTY